MTIVGVQPSRHGSGSVIRYRDSSGRLETDHGSNLHPRTPEVLAAWNRARAKHIESRQLSNAADAIEETIPKIRDVDERLTPPTARRPR